MTSKGQRGLRLTCEDLHQDLEHLSIRHHGGIATRNVKVTLEELPITAAAASNGKTAVSRPAKAGLTAGVLITVRQ